MFARSWVNKVKFTDCSRLIYFPNRLSAVMSIGAATLADIFDPAVRGKKVGINLCVFQSLILYRSWEFTTLDHCLDRYFFTFYRKILIYLFPRLLGPYLEVY